jgi:NADPH-dependent ferric siderophore reductase
LPSDRLLDLIGQPGGPLADARLWGLEVTDSSLLTPHVVRLVMRVEGPVSFRYTAGQDLMFRVPLAADRVVNRRYTIRSFDPVEQVLAVDASLHGTGPGTNWIRSATTGSRIDAIGPRGKITLSDESSWHLFVADETGIPGSLAMIESAPRGSTAVCLFEADSPADEQPVGSHDIDGLEIGWTHRLGRSEPGDPEALLDAVASTELPSQGGHIYVSAEARAVRLIRGALIDRGFAEDRISAKAYWRRGLPNADHGEPTPEAS